MTTSTTQTIVYNGIRINHNVAGAIALNQRFASVEAAISYIDRNFFQ